MTSFRKIFIKKAATSGVLTEVIPVTKAFINLRFAVILTTLSSIFLGFSIKYKIAGIGYFFASSRTVVHHLIKADFFR
jgi:hypothetical protein